MSSCDFCGGEHRRGSREQRECRRTRGKSSEREPTVAEVGERRAGDQMTRYKTDPLKGDKMGHAIAKRLKMGQSERKTAKLFNVSLERVREVSRKLSEASKQAKTP
jgi:hypothetical protein